MPERVGCVLLPVGISPKVRLIANQSKQVGYLIHGVFLPVFDVGKENIRIGVVITFQDIIYIQISGNLSAGAVYRTRCLPGFCVWN